MSNRIQNYVNCARSSIARVRIQMIFVPESVLVFNQKFLGRNMDDLEHAQDIDLHCV
jgi:hypothetical protein